MPNKISFRQTLLGGVSMGLGLVALGLMFLFVLKNPIQSNSDNSGFLLENVDTSVNLEPSASPPTPEQPRRGLPVHLKIPNINVDTTLEHVGLTADGAMDIPKSRDEVAWFALGQRPGEKGSAVMAGHYGRKDGKASVFDNLHKLGPGDKIYIDNDNGETIDFIVRESRRYNPNTDASAVFGSNDGKAHLNLITCEGTWDKNANQYSKRLVVFADMAE